MDHQKCLLLDGFLLGVQVKSWKLYLDKKLYLLLVVIPNEVFYDGSNGDVNKLSTDYSHGGKHLFVNSVID